MGKIFRGSVSKTKKAIECLKVIYKAREPINTPMDLISYFNDHMKAHPGKKFTWFLKKKLTLQYYLSRTKKYKK